VTAATTITIVSAFRFNQDLDLVKGHGWRLFDPTGLQRIRFANKLHVLAQVALATDASEFTATLHEIAAAGQLSDLRWPDFSDYRIHVTTSYEAANYAPAWLNNNEPNKRRC
jgi:hypothetical protein